MQASFGIIIAVKIPIYNYIVIKCLAISEKCMILSGESIFLRNRMSLVCLIKVVPSSGRNAWALDKRGMLKCFLKSAPEKGKANKELIKLLAEALSVGQNNITLISGLTSRTKRVSIDLDITFEQLLEKLGVEYQKEIF